LGTRRTRKRSDRGTGARTIFIAIENTIVNAEGETVSLKPGAEVDVVIEAADEGTIKKSDPPVAVRSV